MGTWLELLRSDKGYLYMFLGAFLFFSGFTAELIRRNLYETRIYKHTILKDFFLRMNRFLTRLSLFVKPMEMGDPDTADWQNKMEELLMDYRELQYLIDRHFLWAVKLPEYQELKFRDCLDSLKSVMAGASLKERDYGFLDQGKQRIRQRKLAKIISEQQIIAEKWLNFVIMKRKVKL